MYITSKYTDNSHNVILLTIVQYTINVDMRTGILYVGILQLTDILKLVVVILPFYIMPVLLNYILAHPVGFN